MIRQWRTNYVVMSTGAAHLVWGLLLFFSTSPLHTTALGHFPVKSHIVAAAIYCLASLLAFAPHVGFLERIFWRVVPNKLNRRLDKQILGLVLTAPQQALLITSLVTVMISVFSGQYSDGYVPDKYGDPHIFILSDQILMVCLVVGHTWSLLDWYLWSMVK